ncbi:MAG: UvrD-helicase domain-containing protein [Candidatus Marinimicrobia bacterium]|nr:UvrD-helicase domain-containing protein [Candidatus Neomarinimicrobiota bacterium]MCF7829344.1 UvrD-helicase domain-containing protein [Candidatus Neomarinimicrobiota bacterium]MCF7879993.1 UvrD-helicase domain-containing protein [Candidatus Neomarinimicrobiota bacterium]
MGEPLILVYVVIIIPSLVGLSWLLHSYFNRDKRTTIHKKHSTELPNKSSLNIQAVPGTYNDNLFDEQKITPIDAKYAPSIDSEDPDDIIILDGKDVISRQEIDDAQFTDGKGSLFDEVRILDESWERIKNHHRLKARLDVLIKWIEYFYSNNQIIINPTIRKVDTTHYKIRLVDGLRIPFSFIENNNGKGVILVFWEILTHEEGVAIHGTGYQPPDLSKTHPLPDEWGIKNLAIEKNEDMVDIPKYPLTRVWYPEDQERLKSNKDADLRWNLHEEQEKYVQRQGPILLKGSAGSGKTTIALYRLLSYRGSNDSNDALYITYTNYLRDYAKRSYQQLVPTDVVSHPNFFTIEDLCRQIIPDADEQFPPERKLTFDTFLTIPAVRQTVLPISVNLLWEEIRGVIKGAFQIVNNNKSTLPLESYLNDISSNQSLVLPKEREIVYEVFTRYQKWITERNYWDELDLARTAYRQVQNSRKIKKFSNIVVDEVQDLTTFHIELILMMSRNPNGLFLTGDAQQVIHPSRFEWARIKEQMYYHIKNLKKRKIYFDDHVKRVQELTTNFRSTDKIVALSNSIASWRNEILNEYNSILTSIRAGKPICKLQPCPASNWTENEHFSTRLMIIVPNEELKKEAQDEFGAGRVFTIFEAKGLERDFVILWKFFTAGEVWKNVHRERHQERFEIKQQLKQQASIFNVAVTRAREQLFFLDTNIPFDWEPLENHTFLDGEQADEYISGVLDLRSRKEDYYEIAKDFEARDLLEQASANYFEAGFDTDAYRSKAIMYERRRDYKWAGINYEYAELFEDAIRCYDKCGEYQKAFKLMLKSGQKAGLSSVQEYLDDERKLAKLDGEIAISVANAILNESPGATIATLFEYSRRRLGLNRYHFGRSVENMRRVQLRDLRQASDSIERAMTQLTVNQKRYGE